MAVDHPDVQVVDQQSHGGAEQYVPAGRRVLRIAVSAHLFPDRILRPGNFLVIRILQGLALGGEYGGAAVYVAEHVPDNRRGFYTSFIQITATLGLFVSLAVILIVQNTMSADQFAGKTEEFAGWRIPFLISIFLVGISLYIRLRMKESPIFQHVKNSGTTSANPLIEAFTKWENLRRRLDFAFRRNRRTRRSLVHRTVLRVVLFAVDLECQCHLGQLHHCHRAAFGNAVFCGFWRIIDVSGENG